MTLSEPPSLSGWIWRQRKMFSVGGSHTSIPDPKTTRSARHSKERIGIPPDPSESSHSTATASAPSSPHLIASDGFVSPLQQLRKLPPGEKQAGRAEPQLDVPTATARSRAFSASGHSSPAAGCMAVFPANQYEAQVVAALRTRFEDLTTTRRLPHDMLFGFVRSNQPRSFKGGAIPTNPASELRKWTDSATKQMRDALALFKSLEIDRFVVEEQPTMDSCMSTLAYDDASTSRIFRPFENSEDDVDGGPSGKGIPAAASPPSVSASAENPSLPLATTVSHNSSELLSAFDAAWPYRVLGHDESGHIAVYDGLGGVSFEGLLSSLGADGALRASAARVEQLRLLKLSLFEDMGVEAYYHTTIVDLRGLSFAHLKNRSFVRRLFAFASTCYPETVHRIYLIHSPSAFPVIWKAIRPWLDPDTSEKIHVLSHREARDLLQQWGEELDGELNSMRASASTISSNSSSVAPRKDFPSS